MVAHPEQELRFTRAAQAVPFWIGGAVLLGAALVLAAISLHRPDHPALPHPLWALPPLALAWAGLRIAHRCTRHAYLILTPLGIEIFPLFRPARSMRLIYWGEIDRAEFGERVLTLHFREPGGVHLSLAPIPPVRRPLLQRALDGRLENDRQATAADRQ